MRPAPNVFADCAETLITLIMMDSLDYFYAERLFHFCVPYGDSMKFFWILNKFVFNTYCVFFNNFAHNVIVFMDWVEAKILLFEAGGLKRHFSLHSMVVKLLCK
jgi:hypothetical protein